jgi:Holliday junction resolvase RusA-like endonuclease
MSQSDVYFTIPGEPVGKGRPRVSCHNGKPRLYTPAKTRYYEDRVGRAAKRAGLPVVQDQPVRVDIVAVSKRPARLRRKKDPDGFIYKPTKPDTDNIRKAVLDGLGRHFDDKLVVSGDTIDLYGGKEVISGFTIVRVRMTLCSPSELLRSLDFAMSATCGSSLALVLLDSE